MELRHFLLECPQMFRYRYNNQVREELRKNLFLSATCNGKYINAFFEGKGKGIGKTKGKGQNGKSDDWVIGNKEIGRPGKPCVRKFTKGEPTYRCL